MQDFDRREEISCIYMDFLRNYSCRMSHLCFELAFLLFLQETICQCSKKGNLYQYIIYGQQEQKLFKVTKLCCKIMLQFLFFGEENQRIIRDLRKHNIANTAVIGVVYIISNLPLACYSTRNVRWCMVYRRIYDIVNHQRLSH